MSGMSMMKASTISDYCKEGLPAGLLAHAWFEVVVDPDGLVHSPADCRHIHKPQNHLVALTFEQIALRSTAQCWNPKRPVFNRNGAHTASDAWAVSVVEMLVAMTARARLLAARRHKGELDRDYLAGAASALRRTRANSREAATSSVHPDLLTELAARCRSLEALVAVSMEDLSTVTADAASRHQTLTAIAEEMVEAGEVPALADIDSTTWVMVACGDVTLLSPHLRETVETMTVASLGVRRVAVLPWWAWNHTVLHTDTRRVDGMEVQMVRTNPDGLAGEIVSLGETCEQMVQWVLPGSMAWTLGEATLPQVALHPQGFTTHGGVGRAALVDLYETQRAELSRMAAAVSPRLPKGRTAPVRVVSDAEVRRAGAARALMGSALGTL